MRRHACHLGASVLLCLFLFPALLPAQSGIVTTFDVADWSGTLTQRGSSTTWDAVWTRGGERVTSVLEGTVTGGQVLMRRVSSSDGVLCEYRGTLSADGRLETVQTCPGHPSLTCAGVTSDPAPGGGGGGGASTPAVRDLGHTVVMMQGNVCATILTRTRPGVYDALTICQGPTTSSFRETFTVESYDGHSVVISRPGYGRYRGTVTGNGRVIRGTCDWVGCTAGYRWTAYLDWNWNDAPPMN